MNYITFKPHLLLNSCLKMEIIYQFEMLRNPALGKQLPYVHKALSKPLPYVHPALSKQLPYVHPALNCPISGHDFWPKVTTCTHVWKLSSLWNT